MSPTALSAELSISTMFNKYLFLNSPVRTTILSLLYGHQHKILFLICLFSIDEFITPLGLVLLWFSEGKVDEYIDQWHIDFIFPVFIV